MEKFILLIDTVTAWVGKAFAWCIMIMAVGIGYEVFVRYIMRDPTSWAFDISYMMFGALFMMAGAYTLSTEAHVRGDVIYRLFPVRVQGSIDLVLYFIFFFPGVLALAFYGWDYAAQAWKIKETSWNSPAQIQIYMAKSMIPLAGFLLIIQGISEVFRSIICIQTGHWPKRASADAEETEKVLMRTSQDQDQKDVI